MEYSIKNLASQIRDKHQISPGRLEESNGIPDNNKNVNKETQVLNKSSRKDEAM